MEGGNRERELKSHWVEGPGIPPLRPRGGWRKDGARGSFDSVGVVKPQVIRSSWLLGAHSWRGYLPEVDGCGWVGGGAGSE